MAGPEAEKKDTKVEQDASNGKKEEKKEDPTEIKEEDLSDEDLKLKRDLDSTVERLKDPDTGAQTAALESLRKSIRSATTTMTSVPKPLKFLKPHYKTVEEYFTACADGTQNKALSADVMSMLSMTQEGLGRVVLKYRFVGSKHEPVSSWGHEYVRHLQGEIAEEYAERVASEEDTADLIALAAEIVPYYMSHNAEADACDLLMEVERLDLLGPHVDEKSYERVCLYLMSCVPYVAEGENTTLLHTCLEIFRRFEQFPQALHMTLKINNMDLIKDVFKQCTDKSVRRQMAFILGRQQIMFDVQEVLEGEDDDEIETLTHIMGNQNLNESFLTLARELDITEPKTPEDIYKTHLEAAGRSSAQAVESARGNLAATFVNGFVNAGFGSDKLILGGEEGSKWLYKNKEHGMMSAAASLGLLYLWDVDGGLTVIDAHMQAPQDYVKAGALLAIGIVNSTVRNEHEPALALLQDYTMHDKPLFRIGANMGLGLAYAGTSNQIVSELLLPVLEAPSSTMEVLGTTALALGQIFVGTCDGTISQAILQLILSKEPKELEEAHARKLALALGLIYLGKQNEAEVTLATLDALPGSFGRIARVLVDACAYAGTGNALKVQGFLHTVSEHFDTEKDGEELSDLHQAYATVGIALVAMGEEIGMEMALRTMNHLLQYGEPAIRRAVPLAMALLCVSNPVLTVLDTLSKLSHDPDAEVAYNSIFAMGIVGAGTNHARIAGMLRLLAQYYHKDPNALFVVRIAQGLLHTGKGSITLSPFHTDRLLMSPPAVAGLLATILEMVDSKSTVLGSASYSLFNLSIAMYPRILSTFDEELKPVNTSVRVGQAVDVVGQAGKPKTITGFVTNNTPVLLAYGERAQLATEEYIPLTPILEGFVIVRKNPAHV